MEGEKVNGTQYHGVMRFMLLVLAFLGTAVYCDGIPFERALRNSRSDLRVSVPRFDEALAATCQKRAQELAALGELSHVDTRQRGPGVQAMDDGLAPGEYGEVLGSGLSEAEVWKAWMASPTHRLVLADSGWVTWGVGTALRGTVVVYVVRFWRP